MLTFNRTIGPSIVVDTGILLEYLVGTKEGKIIEEMVFNNSYIASIYTSPLTLIEIYYLIRRKSTRERAKKVLIKIRKIVASVPIESYIELVGEIKAVTAFSLTDTANIALGVSKDIPILFKHEQEIDKKIKNNKSSFFTSKIVFIDDFQYYQKRINNS